MSPLFDGLLCSGHPSWRRRQSTSQVRGPGIQIKSILSFYAWGQAISSTSTQRVSKTRNMILILISRVKELQERPSTSATASRTDRLQNEKGNGNHRDSRSKGVRERGAARRGEQQVPSSSSSPLLSSPLLLFTEFPLLFFGGSFSFEPTNER